MSFDNSVWSKCDSACFIPAIFVMKTSAKLLKRISTRFSLERKKNNIYILQNLQNFIVIKIICYSSNHIFEQKVL